VLEAGDQPDDDVDPILRDELAGLVDRPLGGGLVVLDQELDFTPSGASGCVHLLDRQLEAVELGLAEYRLKPRQRRQEADLHLVLRLQDGGKAEPPRRHRRGAADALERGPPRHRSRLRQLPHHAVLPPYSAEWPSAGLVN